MKKLILIAALLLASNPADSMSLVKTSLIYC